MKDTDVHNSSYTIRDIYLIDSENGDCYFISCYSEDKLTVVTLLFCFVFIIICEVERRLNN